MKSKSLFKGVLNFAEILLLQLSFVLLENVRGQDKTIACLVVLACLVVIGLVQAGFITFDLGCPSMPLFYNQYQDHYQN